MSTLLSSNPSSSFINYTIPTGTFAGKKIKFDKSRLNTIEEVLVLYPHYAKADGEKFIKKYKPGETYRVGGLQKAEIILTGWATLDLQAELPKLNKRTIEQAKNSVPVKPISQMALEQMQTIADAFEKLGKVMESITNKLSKKGID